ncbi:hypothetical protein ASE01_18125 [Nocardioides sp. Root190]|nr:hypothetical protein ASE01_18125 [Nocardioides sp. Root190]
MAGSLIVLGAVPGSLPAASAASSVVVVDGFDWPSSLGYITDGCDPGDSAPGFDPQYRRQGLRGHRSIGFGFGGTGGMAGVEARVATPRSLTDARFGVYYPEASGGGLGRQGVIKVSYATSPDGFGYPYYVGILDLHLHDAGWTSVTGVGSADLHWYLFDGATYTAQNVQASVAEFAQSKGTDGSGAWVGFELGCDGRTHYMDDLRLTTASGTRTYDFEGAESESSLTAATSHDGHTFKRDITSLRLVKGETHRIYGDSYGYSDGVQDDGYLDGVAHLWERRYGANWRRVASANYLSTGYARFAIAPAKKTLYLVKTVPTLTPFTPSTSLTLTVDVRRTLSARVADTRIRKGKRISVSGRINPTDSGVSVLLQRYRDGAWRTVARTTTTSGGRYSVGVRARTVGTWRMRITVPTAKGNLGTSSSAQTVRVVRAAPPAVVEPVTYVSPVPTPVFHDPIDAKDPGTHHRQVAPPHGRKVGTSRGAVPVAP